jgi:uncharacterized protein YbjQ (UPF0145 family)
VNATQPPAGWHPDPHDPSQLRYWDGSQWTEHRSPAQSQQPAAQPQQPAAQAQQGATVPGGSLQPSSGAINAPLSQYQGPDVMIVTANWIPGYDVVEVYGEIFGLVVRARNAFSNIGAGFRTLVGGEAKGYTKLVSDSRHEAVQRLKAEAAARGANAVIAMRFDCNEIADLMSEVAAYGTAVKVVKSGEPATA